MSISASVMSKTSAAKSATAGNEARMAFYWFPRVFKSVSDTIDRGLRPLSLVRPGVDALLLPDHPLCRESWELLRPVFGLEKEQAVFFVSEMLPGPYGTMSSDLADGPAPVRHEGAAEAFSRRPDLLRPTASGTFRPAPGCSDSIHREMACRSAVLAPSREAAASGSGAATPATRAAEEHEYGLTVLCPMFVTEELAQAFRAMELRLFGDAWDSVVQKSWLHPQPPMDLPPRAALGGACSFVDLGATVASSAASVEEESRPGASPTVAAGEDRPAAALSVAPSLPVGATVSADTSTTESVALGAPIEAVGGSSAASGAATAPEPVAVSHLAPVGAEGAAVTECLSAGTWQGAAVDAGILPSGAASLVAQSDEKPRPLPACFSDLPGIYRGVDTPLGYRCGTVEELLVAFDRLTQVEGVKRVVLKPSDGASSGDGIVFDVRREQLESYVFDASSCASGDVVSLEEMMDLEIGADGGVVSPVMHYVGGEECGEAAEQIIHKGCVFGGNRSPAVASYDPAMLARCTEIAAAFSDSVGLRGFWGLDFLVDAKTGRPALTDVNSGRPNGGQPAKIFAGLRCGGARYFRFFKSKAAGAARGGLEGLLGALREEGMLLQLPAAGAVEASVEEVPSGAVPFSYVRGSHASMYVVGRSNDELSRLEGKLEAILGGLVAPEREAAGSKAAAAEMAAAVVESTGEAVAVA